jgi:hypothetical protein
MPLGAAQAWSPFSRIRRVLRFVFCITVLWEEGSPVQIVGSVLVYAYNPGPIVSERDDKVSTNVSRMFSSRIGSDLTSRHLELWLTLSSLKLRNTSGKTLASSILVLTELVRACWAMWRSHQTQGPPRGVGRAPEHQIIGSATPGSTPGA